MGTWARTATKKRKRTSKYGKGEEKIEPIDVKIIVRKE